MKTFLQQAALFLLFLTGASRYGQGQVNFKTETYNELNTAAYIKGLGSSSGYGDALHTVVYDRWDAMVASASWTGQFKFKQLRSYVKAGIDHANIANNIGNFDYIINLQVKGYTNPQNLATTETETIQLRISYDKDSLDIYPDQHQVLLKKGYCKFETKLLGIQDAVTLAPVSKADLAINFFIETGILLQRIDLVTPNIYIGSEYLSASRTLKVFWSDQGPRHDQLPGNRY
ncbi:MAG: hypothetical protein KL787_05645 [Taibaiella sp.]|nr:hypothetical protein [Taibaiella sp.]